jgi:hypothetical protein
VKIFWSWQADTPGKTGRHFVRSALAEAVAALKQPEDIEEPAAGAAREALHLDHDRQGVAGSPDLAATIFRKIDAAAVFIADVTLVGSTDAATQEAAVANSLKRLINSNVAIEYGYAQRGLGDEAILMVQNTYYGDREGLPFDLKHKAGPIQYSLAPDASRKEIEPERAKLRAVLIEALKPYLSRGATAPVNAPFKEVPSTTTSAFFWQPGEVLAHLGSTRPAALRHPSEAEDAIDYRFDEPRAFYLRLLPKLPLAGAFSTTSLMRIVERRQLRVLSRAGIGGWPGRNGYGAIAFEPHGTATTPVAFTQLFRNGEIWGVTRELAVRYYEKLVVPMVNVSNVYRQTLASYIATAQDALGVPPPYDVEIGAVGLREMCLSLPVPNPYNEVSGPVYDYEFKRRSILNDISEASQQTLVEQFTAGLYDLAGIGS